MAALVGAALVVSVLAYGPDLDWENWLGKIAGKERKENKGTEPEFRRMASRSPSGGAEKKPTPREEGGTAGGFEDLQSIQELVEEQTPDAARRVIQKPTETQGAGIGTVVEVVRKEPERSPTEVPSPVPSPIPTVEPTAVPTKIPTARTAEPPKEKSPGEFVVRYAFCLLRESAEVVKKELEKKGIRTTVLETKGEVDSFRIAVGPFEAEGESDRAEKKIRAEGLKPERFTSERNTYISLGFFYNRQETDKIERRLKSMGFRVLVQPGRTERTVYKVVSDRFPTREGADAFKQKLRGQGVQSIVEQVGP